MSIPQDPKIWVLYSSQKNKRDLSHMKVYLLSFQKMSCRTFRVVAFLYKYDFEETSLEAPNGVILPNPALERNADSW